MNKLFLCCIAALCLQVKASAQAQPVPKAPVPMPKSVATSYINNYKSSVNNFFAHGYLIDIVKAKSISANGVRVYNGLTGTDQSLVMVPLLPNYKVNASGTNIMQNSSSLCPHECDIASPGEAAQVNGSQVSTLVNACMECHKYEGVNAMVLHTTTLVSLLGLGYNYARVYNGMDAGGKRFVVYVPINAGGQEVWPETLYVGDFTNTLVNCRYP
jgi:hypothetical protein